MSPVGEQFCQTCGELLVLAEPVTEDIPVLDYSSESFSEYLARSDLPAPAPPAEMAHEPNRSRPVTPRASPAPPSAPDPPGAPPAFDAFTRPPASAAPAHWSPAPPRPAPPPSQVTASRPHLVGPAGEPFTGAPPEPRQPPGEPAEGFAVPWPSSGEPPGAPAGPGQPPAGPAGDSFAPGWPREGATPPKDSPGAAPVPPSRLPSVLLTLGTVIMLAIGATALTLALNKRFAANSPGRPPSASTPSVRASQTPVAATTSWSAPSPVPASVLDGAVLTGISCPLPSTCYATDSAGKVLSSTRPGPWQVVANDRAGGLTAISCATVDFCLALDRSGHAVFLRGSVAATPIYVDARRGVFTAVSCPSSSFCMTTDSGGNAFAYTPAGWRPFTVDAGGAALTGVSCLSPQFCAAVDSDGSAYTYNGTSWSAGSRVGDGQPLKSVSCGNDRFCMAVDDSGHSGLFTGRHWKSENMPITALAVVCPADGFCLATGNAGNAVVYRAGEWSRPKAIDGAAAIGLLACPSVTGCAAADPQGNVMYYVPAIAAG